MQDIDQQSSVAPKSQTRRQNWQTAIETQIEANGGSKTGENGRISCGATVAPRFVTIAPALRHRAETTIVEFRGESDGISQADAVFAYGGSVCDKQGDEHDGSR